MIGGTKGWFLSVIVRPGKGDLVVLLLIGLGSSCLLKLSRPGMSGRQS